MFGTTGDFKLSLLEHLAVKVLKMGPIPNHIALILDGNRRFAKKNNFTNVWEGHRIGFNHVDKVVDIFLALGVNEMTIYVFSIENFKRPAKEVEEIMEILKEKTEIYEERMKCMENKGIFYEYLGNLDLTPRSDLREQIEKNVILSKDVSSKKLKLNVAYIYTGRSEITKGTNTVIEGLSSGQIETDDVSEEFLKECFTIHSSNPVDIMIRTSGESRLSDYLLWGCSEAQLEFIPETWPEFSAWRLIKTIFKYQTQNRKKFDVDVEDELKFNSGQVKFLEKMRSQKCNELKRQ